MLAAIRAIDGSLKLEMERGASLHFTQLNDLTDNKLAASTSNDSTMMIQSDTLILPNKINTKPSISSPKRLVVEISNDDDLSKKDSVVGSRNILNPSQQSQHKKTGNTIKPKLNTLTSSLEFPSIAILMFCDSSTTKPYPKSDVLELLFSIAQGGDNISTSSPTRLTSMALHCALHGALSLASVAASRDCPSEHCIKAQQVLLELIPCLTISLDLLCAWSASRRTLVVALKDISTELVEMKKVKYSHTDIDLAKSSSLLKYFLI